MHDSNKNDDMTVDRDKVAPSKRRRSRWRTLWRWTIKGILTLLGLVALFLAALIVVLRTESGAALLTRLVPEVFNSLDLGMRMELSSLRGPLPEELRIRGLRLMDRRGLWLEVPSAYLALRPGSLLPRAGGWTLEAERLRLSDVRLLRTPDLPPSTPTPPSMPEPLSLLPSWLKVDADRLRVYRVYLGPELLGAPGLGLTGDLRGSATVGARTADLRLEISRLRPDTGWPQEGETTAVKTELGEFLEQLTGRSADEQSLQEIFKQSLQQSRLPSLKQAAERATEKAAVPLAAGYPEVKVPAVLPDMGSHPLFTRQSLQLSRVLSHYVAPKMSRQNKEEAIPALQATLDARWADDTLTVRLDAEDGALLSHFVPALDGGLLQAALSAHAPLLPPTAEEPLRMRLRGEFALRAVGQASFGQMSALGLELGWDGTRLTLPALELSMPAVKPRVSLRGGGGLDPVLGPGADLTVDVRDLRTLGILLGLPPDRLAGAVSARLELGHGRTINDWWRDSERNSGVDESVLSTGDSSSNNMADGSRENSRDDTWDSSRNSAHDRSRDVLANSHATSRDDGAQNSPSDSASFKGSDSAPDRFYDGSRDSQTDGSGDAGVMVPVAPLRLALGVSGDNLLLPGGPVDALKMSLTGEAAPGAVAMATPGAASGTLRITARSLFGMGAAQVSTDWALAGLHGAEPRGSVRRLDARIPGLRVSGDMEASLPVSTGAAGAAVPEAEGKNSGNAAGEPGAARSDATTTGWPLLNGRLDVKITDWEALARLLGTPLRGGAASARLEARPESVRQRADLRWDVQRFRAADAVELAFCKGELHSTDIYGVIEGLLRGAPEEERTGGGETTSKGAKGGIPGEDASPRMAATLDGSLQLGAGSAGPVRWDSGRATVRVRDEQSMFEAVLRGPVDATVRGSYHFGDRLLRMNVLEVSETAYGLGLRLNHSAEVSFLRGLEIGELALSLSPGGTVGLRARLAPDNLKLEASIQDLPLIIARKLADVPVEGGTLSASVRLGGTPAAPSGHLEARLADVPLSAVPGAPQAGLTVTGDLEGAGRGGVHNLRLSATIDGIEGLGHAGDSEGLTATASLPLRFDPVPSVAESAPFAARVFWRGDVAPLWRLVPLPGRTLSGRGQISATAEGTLRSPRLDVAAFLGGGRYVDKVEGVVLTDIAMEARYAADGTSQLRLAAGDGRGGTLALDGSLTDLASHPRVAARGLVRNLRPLHRDDLAVQVSGSMAVTGPLSSPFIRADMRMDQGAYQILDDFGGGVTTLDGVVRGTGAQPCRDDPFVATGQPLVRRDGAAAETAARAAGEHRVMSGQPPAPTKSKRRGKNPERAKKVDTVPAAVAAEQAQKYADVGPRLDLKVTAPGKFFIRGKGLESEWRANLAVTGTIAQPRLVGELAPVQGQFALLGRTFVFEQGNVTFDGADPPNPLLNLTLDYQGPQITALIMVRGTARHPRLDLSSRPVLPKDEIMAQVLFGKSMSNLSRFETLQAAAAAAQLVGGGPSALDVLSKTRDMLGLQVLRVGSADGQNLQHVAPRDASQQGTVTDTGAQAPTLEAGKYVLDNVYVGVEQGADPGAGTSVRVNIDLFPHVSLEGRTSNEASGVGINWKLDY